MELEEFARRYHSLVENIPDVAFSLDEHGIMLTVNKAINTYGYSCAEVLGRPLLELIHIDDREEVAHEFKKIVVRGQNYVQTLQFRLCTKTGNIRWVESNSAYQFTPAGHFIIQEGVCRDVTESRAARQALRKTQDELEGLVFQRTKELLRTNSLLQKEVEDRRETERTLRHREKQLQIQKADLQVANTALKVLLKRREMDKHDLEEQVIYNVKKMLLPYVEKLRKKASNERKMAYLSILETNLNEITNSFSRRLSAEFSGLTGSELKVANFIRQGKKTGEIAKLLGLSERTIEAYRQSIRQKLRIQNKKMNLRTYLMSFDGLGDSINTHSTKSRKDMKNKKNLQE